MNSLFSAAANATNNSEEEDATLTHVAILGAMIVLGAYLIFGAFAEHKEIKFIHETGFGIIMGVIIGAIFAFAYPEFYQKALTFSPELFMLLILPPIIFAGGYNLKKRRFFQNFFYITLYGLLGTLVNFGIVAGLTIAINELGWVRRYSNFSQEIPLGIGEILIFSATICATDSVAALTMIKPSKYPKLFSVIFGEGMVNDSVSIILFYSVASLFPVDKAEEPFEWYTTFSLIGQFLLTAAGSVVVGLALGFFGSILTKYFRFIAHNSVIETAVIFICGYIAYVIAETLTWSGVIAILVAGIIMSHYLFYNLSARAQVTSKGTIAFISVIMEAFLYVYLGISVWQQKTQKHEQSDAIAWSWTFVLLEMVILLIARVTSILGLSYLVKTCKKNFRLNIYEMSIITYSGIIRGAIAFALIMTLPTNNDEDPTRVDPAKNTAIQVLQSSTQFIVIFTTVVMGGTMPLFINWCMNQIANSPDLANPSHVSKLSMEEQEFKQGSTLRKTLLEEGESKKDRSYKGGTQKWYKGIDERLFKPWFIYDYKNRKAAIRMQKKKARMLEDNPTEMIKQSMIEEEIVSQRKESMMSQSSMQMSQSEVQVENEEQQSRFREEQVGHVINFNTEISNPDKDGPLTQEKLKSREQSQQSNLELSNQNSNENLK